MSMSSRREYIQVMYERYRQAKNRAAKSQIIDQVVATLACHRKHALRVLAGPRPSKPKKKVTRPLRYREALPAIQLAWQALNYPCAERLHPVLSSVAEELCRHGELALTAQACQQLAQISRSTLARRLATLPVPAVRLHYRKTTAGALLSQIPIGTYAWNEQRPGALQIDLVEHNGGSSRGHFAYTLDVVDVVSGWSRRRAVLGRGQKGVFTALDMILAEWPGQVWAIHSDNGSEFISDQLIKYTKRHELLFTRSRPYHKNDNAHVEQRNRQFVRQIVGYDRYDQPAHIDWLNQVYALLDPYANLFLPTQKLLSRTREGGRLRRRFDTAATPLQRLTGIGALGSDELANLEQQRTSLNPLRLHEKLEKTIMTGPETVSRPAMVADC